MKLVEVSPISGKVQKDTLTYFSAKDISVGDVVTIEVRKSKYDALVVGISDVEDLKQEIKTATFGFKKIESLKGPSKFSKEFFKSCQETREFFVGNLGAIVNFFLPTELLDNYGEIGKPCARIKNVDGEFSALQKKESERIEFYKKYICEMFAKNKSVQIILPTVSKVRKFHELLISDFDLPAQSGNIFIFHGKGKNILEKYNSLLAEKNPTLIISTPSFLFIPRHDLGAIVVEHESSSAYRTLKKPYFDIRTFAVTLARNLKTNLIFADEFLSAETIAKIQDKKTLDFDLGAKVPKIVDMTDKENLYKKSFVFSNDAVEILKKDSRVFLFALRKGLATQVVCHDCGQMLKDGDAPLVLFERDGKRILKNAFTSKVVESLRCSNCGSWNFDSLGIGTDTVVAEIKKLFPARNAAHNAAGGPKRKVLQIDKEITKSESAAKKVATEFYENENAILVGTEMAIPYLMEKIDSSIIVSMDSILHIPSYKSYERMLHLSFAIGNATKENFLIQTRDTENPVMSALATKNLKDFYKNEIVRRETFGYPPFMTVLKLTHTSRKDDFENIRELAEIALVKYEPNTRRKKLGKFFVTTIVLRLPHDNWNAGTLKQGVSIDKNLYQVLASLGPDWQIRINPENLF